jgi:tetratricopeptide (TPR) repeat protein
MCLRRINLPAAFWVAALFALHPVEVESVAWITELKNVLSLFSYLLSLLAYLRFSDAADGPDRGGKGCWGFYAVSLLFFLCALFSKTVSGSLPVAILLVRWWQHGRIRMKDMVRMVPFFLMAMILGAQTARLEVSHVLAKGPEWDFSIVDRFLIAGRAVWFYAGKLLWPSPLIFNYPRWTIDAGQWWQYLFPAALILALVALWLLRPRIGRGPLAAALYFVVTLFPALGFFNVYPMRFSFVADHFQYGASIGVIMLLCGAIGLVRHWLPQRSGNAAVIFLAVALAVLSLLTWRQGRIYKDNLALFSDTIDKNPASWFSYANRAAFYANTGREALAIADLERSISLKPDEADSFHTRGVLYLKKRDFDQAFSDLNRSIAIRPWRTDYYRNRSIAYKFAKRFDKALADSDKVIALEPYDAQNYLNRAAIYAEVENYSRALVDLNAACEIDPDDYRVYSNRGLVYYRLGELSRAIGDFDRALSLYPSSAETYYNRGLALAAAGEAARARSDLVKARELGNSLDNSEIERILAHKKQGAPSGKYRD